MVLRLLYALIISLLLVVSAILLFDAPKLLKVSECVPCEDEQMFTAHCNSEDFGDYEFGALAMGFEEMALDKMKDADILFLGNSRIQVAFSTEATKNIMLGHSASYYLAGFSGGGVEEATELLTNYPISARYIIINADPFFLKPGQLPLKLLKTSPVESYLRYGYKKFMIRLQTSYCSDNTSGFFYDRLCGGSKKTVLRAKDNGMWILAKYLDDNKIPVAERGGYSEEDIAKSIDRAKEFIGILPKGSRIVLTATASNYANKNYVVRIADALGLDYIYLGDDDYATYDKSHLNIHSAELFSARFLKCFFETMYDPKVVGTQ